MYIFYKPVKRMLVSYNTFKIKPIPRIDIRKAVIIWLLKAANIVYFTIVPKCFVCNWKYMI